MNFIKRGLLNITRKKGKSIILFAIIFILGNLIAGAISIQQATNSVEVTIKERMGTAATIEMDYQKYDEYMMGLSEEELMNFDYFFDSIGVDLIKQVGELKYVKYYDYSTSSYLASNQIKSIQPDEMEGFSYSIEGYVMDFRLKGTNYAPILDFEEGKSQLVDGRVFTQEELENESTVAVISKKLAETNNLHVGDTFVLTNLVMDYSKEEEEIYSSRDIVLEIIGLFEPMNVDRESNNARDDGMWNYMDTEIQNTIYVSNGIISSENSYSMEKMMELDKEYAEMMGDREYQDHFTPMFILNSIDDVEAFKEEVMPLLPEFYTVRTATDQYDSISGPIKSMSKLSGYVLLVSVVASILIIGLVVLLFLRDRKRELGIYLSLGESRGRVVGQILIEVMIIALVGITLSLFTGHLLASGVSDTLMKNDSGSQPVEEVYYYSEIQSDLSTTDVLDSYQISLSFTYILLFLGVGLATVLLSTIVPLIYIVRLNPKKILM
ncbi:ABC transporter permease [Bacillus alkalicellulosilyticus]|uniref:ABC transporter permease n=1 Tax=Alkalihalobacterium alkalicellulosilyticum TaxID=1912214 RepID=UPI000998CFCE|nr:FtsX-like permease family protein [Bacillus alkalicellulosilyticus]